MTPATQAMFDAIVLGGAYSAKGMGSFDDVISAADMQAVHTCSVDQAWQMKPAASARTP